MKFLIDNQRALDLPLSRTEGEEGVVELAMFDTAYQILDAWQKLDLAHRAFRYGGDADDNRPSEIVIAWVSASGALEFLDVDPFFDGIDVLNGYDLKHLANALPEGAVKWGDDL